MAGTPLLSLLHISDLHFGVPPVYAGGAPTKWRHLEACDGWLGHHDAALKHLAEFALAEPAAAQWMLFTGDLTACGHPDEFALATDYVRSSVKLKFGRYGLRHKKVLGRGIPGNHDHWPGSIRVVGAANPQLEATFPHLPFDPVTTTLANGKKLTIAGINSDAEIRGVGLPRFLARGHFVGQLQTLQAMMGPPEQDTIRILLLHHSPSWQAKRLAISEASRRALWEFVGQQGISVLLTGHIHVPIGRITEVVHDRRRWEVLEARCGTTTQIDVMPLNWVAAGTNEPGRFPRNSLLRHRLVDHGKRIDWEVDLYWRRDTGFDRPVALTRPIQVWPR